MAANLENENPPGPAHARPIKTLHQFIRNPIGVLTNLAKENGDISYFKLGRQRVYLINDPNLIEQILIRDHSNFTKGRRAQIAKGLLGEGLVTSEGEFHRRQRKMIQPILLPKQIRKYGEIMANFSSRMSSSWSAGSVLDIQKEMMQLTLLVISKSVLNYDVQSEVQSIGKALNVCRTYSKRLQSPLGQVLNKVPILPRVRGAVKAKNELNSIVYGLIKKRREDMLKNSNDNKVDDLLTKLLEASNHESYDNHCNSRLEMMSDQQVRDEVMTIFLAGHETTANALTWTFYLLSQNTKIEAKIHEELDDVLDPIDKITSVADIQWLHYTEKVFIESMRLYPPVWLIGRTVNSEYVVSKYAIPAGSSLLMSQYIMHHDSRYYS
jgi:cytochrome P450